VGGKKAKEQNMAESGLDCECKGHVRGSIEGGLRMARPRRTHALASSALFEVQNNVRRWTSEKWSVF
jgi:hypothetical protein